MIAFPRRAGEPAAEPFTFAQVLHHLRQDDLGPADEAYITALIAVARRTCEDRTERTLIHTPWRLRLDTFPDGVPLFNPPVASITSVVFRDAAGVQQTLEPDDYALDSDRDPGWLVPAPGRGWPATGPGINAVQVSYVAGYGATGESIPQPLQHWMLLAISQMYDTRSAGAERAQVPHDFADALLAPYRILGA